MITLLTALSFTVVSASEGSFSDRIFGSPKALHQTYSCCVYRGGTEEDYHCKAEDDECRKDYEDRVTVYLIVSLCIIFLVILCCVLRCVKKRRLELELKRKAKKAPMPYPNKKDFDPIGKEQGESENNKGAGSGNILAAVFELSKNKAAQNNQPKPIMLPKG